jgi:hypothetical protein
MGCVVEPAIRASLDYRIKLAVDLAELIQKLA